MEKFFKIQIGKHIQIKDSLNFLPTSLDKLVQVRRKQAKNLQDLIQLFPNTWSFFKKEYSHLPEETFELLTHKGVYPYSYMDSHDKFQEKCLPPQHEYKSVDGEIISDEQYKFGRDIWDKFKLSTLGHLHDLYLSTDTNLLADVFNGFRDTAYKAYNLDPVHYVSAPSLSWSAALKMTKVELQLLDDIDKVLFVDKCMVGMYLKLLTYF